MLYNGVAAHIGTQSLGDFDRVFLAVEAEVVFEQGYKHSRGSNNGVVEGVCEILLAIGALDADAESACLRFAEVGAGANLEILLLFRAPCLNVIGLDLKVG